MSRRALLIPVLWLVACADQPGRAGSPWTPGASGDPSGDPTGETGDSGPGDDGGAANGDGGPTSDSGDGPGGEGGIESSGGAGETFGTTSGGDSTGESPASVWGGLEQNGSQIPRAGLENPTLENTLGILIEPYGDVIVVDGQEWVQGPLSWFGGPDDTGVGATETGAITGEILRELNDPMDPTPDDLASRPEDFYYVAMRWSYQPNGPSFWQDARLVIRNPATGAAIVVRPVDWGPNTSTQRIVDLSPQSLVDLGLDTDDDAQVAFAIAGAPLGVVQP